MLGLFRSLYRVTFKFLEPLSLLYVHFLDELAELVCCDDLSNASQHFWF